MKLDKLRIANFKNLRNFEIDFDQKSLTTVLVGRNGSGKSNLLEALILIFRDLDLNAPPTFKYELDYICRGHTIHIDADPDRRPAYVINTNDKPISPSQFAADRDTYLPSFIFGYYSGPSNRMEQHFERHQERFYRDLLDGVDKPLRRLFYARLVHSQFVLLSFFNERDPLILGFLEKHLRIQALESTLFVMREPPWKSSKGDRRFWNADGTVRVFLDRLYALALAPIRMKQTIKLDFREKTSLEHLYLYLSNPEKLIELSKSYPSQQEFFKALESTYISKLVSDVRIKVRVQRSEGALTYRELSEGEQQLLMVLGLLRFTREDESLFLLDEPDTHLNPVWAVQYLEFLQEVVGKQDTSHVIMTTHNPLTIAGLTRPQVQLVKRDDDTGHISANPPEQDPRGMGVAALLTSDVFGLRSHLDLPTLELLDEKRELAAKDQLSSEDVKRLDELNGQLSMLDFTKETRDPTYGAFARAWAKIEQEQGLQKLTLTEAEREKRMKLATELLKSLRAKEKAEQ